MKMKLDTMFRSLKYRNYKLFFSGQSISLIGTWMQRIALPWLVYHKTGSAFLLGVVGFAGQIPTFLLSPLAGVVTDRFSRYKVLLTTQIISLVQALFLAVLALTGAIEIWHIVVLSIILGCINAFDVPARHSFVIQMVEKKEDLGNAIALNSLMFNGARLIGPTVAGIMLATTGEGVCFLINAVSYIFVIVSILMMRVERREIPKKNTRMISELKEGFHYTFGSMPIKHLIILLAVVNLFGSSYQVLMPVFAREILHGGSDIFGFLMGAAGLGALAGAAYLASRESVLRLGKNIPFAAAIFGIGLVMLALTNFLPVTLFLMVIIGLGLMLHTASSNTILQTITTDEMRGRVMSFYTMAIMGTAPFGSLLAGSLAKIIGTQQAILISGIVCILGAAVFMRVLPVLKKEVAPVYEKLSAEAQTGPPSLVNVEKSADPDDLL
jgi:MFS family permease